MFIVNIINSIFAGCSSLELLPDISIWKTDNLLYIQSLFCNCTSLKTIPDISKWKLYNEFDDLRKVMKISLDGRYSIVSNYIKFEIPFNKIKQIPLVNLFCNCLSLQSIPDISKWNVSNVTNISCLFEGCSKLKSLPDLSKWNFFF